MATPNMNLVLPVAGVGGTPGPTWATQLNNNFTLIDSHDHSSGNGSAITPAGLNITSDLSFVSNNAIDLRSTRFTSQGTALSGISDLNCIFVQNGDLKYRNSSGAVVGITNGGALDVSSVGGITGMAGTGAAVTYSNVTKKFTFTQSAGISAHLDAGYIVLREAVASAAGVTLQSPNSLVSSYSLTFPVSLPGSSNFVTIDPSGNVGADLFVDNSTIEVLTNTIQVKNGGITQIKRSTMTTVNPAPIGDLATANCTSFSTSSTSYVDITGLSATITTMGRPVRVGLMSISGGGTASSMKITNANAGEPTDFTIRILREATVIGDFKFYGTTPTVVGSLNFAMSPCSVNSIDSVGPASMTYKIQVFVASAYSTFTLTNTAMYVYEL